MLCRKIKKQNFQAVREAIFSKARAGALSPISEIDFDINGTSYTLFTIADKPNTVYVLYAIQRDRAPVSGSVTYTTITDSLLLNGLTDLLVFQSLKQT